MKVTRRAFVFFFWFRPAQANTFRVRVLEIFPAEDVHAVLVNHADAASRETFARWLQAHTRSSIRVRTENGQEGPATMFRVRMCFGRGLIVMPKALQARERGLLTLTCGSQPVDRC